MTLRSMRSWSLMARCELGPTSASILSTRCCPTPIPDSCARASAARATAAEARHLSREALDRAISGGGYTFKTLQQGAAGSVLLATWPALEGVGGRYFEDANEALPHTPGMSGGVAEHALDPQAARRLWEVSQAMLRDA